MMSNSQGFNNSQDYTQKNLSNLTYEDACRRAYGNWDDLMELNNLLQKLVKKASKKSMFYHFYYVNLLLKFMLYVFNSISIG